MMFLIRTADGREPTASGVEIKLKRRTPAIVRADSAQVDFFCIGDKEAAEALRRDGWTVIDLRDGWYEDDAGGGVGISGHGKYWEIRDTHFTVKEAVGPVGSAPAAETSGEIVNVRRAIFGA